MVAVVSHNLRRGKVLDVDDAFGGIWYVLTRSEHRVLPYKRVRTDSIEAIVCSVYSDLRIPATVSLALIGGVAGVFFSGGVLSVASLIGFITVFGIATRNGIMLVSHIRHLQTHEGVTGFREAVFRGAMERLAPILMTALAAGLALIPLALSGEKPGNEIQTPMAIVILGGLLTSMFLNMILVPTLYLRFGRPTQPVPEGGDR